MKYGQNKQFKVSQYTAAAAPHKINEGAHQENKKMRQIVHTMLSQKLIALTLLLKIETHIINLAALIFKH